MLASLPSPTRRALIFAAAALVLSLTAAGCGLGGGSDSSSSGSVTSPGERVLRTVDEPFEIYPLTLSSEDELLEFAVEAYQIYRELAREPGREPNYRLPEIEDEEEMSAELGGICFALTQRPTAQDLGERIEDFKLVEEDPDKQQRLRVLVWLGVSLQFDKAEPPDPDDFENPEDVPEHIPEYKTFCEP